MDEDPVAAHSPRLATLLRRLGEAAEREAAARSQLASSAGRVLSARSADPAALLEAVTSVSAAFDSAVVLSQSGDGWRVAAAVGGAGASDTRALDLGAGALADTLRSGDASRLGVAEIPEELLPEATRSACAVPLLDRDAAPFALALFGSRTEHQLGDDDILLARCGAERVARALEMAELAVAARRAEETARRSAGFRDQILAIVGHDLRNPLGAIVMSAALLQKRGGLGGWQARTVDRVRSSAARMGRIIDDLLSYTRTRLGGGIPIERAPANLGEITRRMVDELRAAKPEARIQITSSGDLAGEWDATRLEQVVSNLVSNAIDHGDDSQPIAIDVRGGEAVELSVENHGEMPYEALQHAFEAFRRGPEQTGRKASGLGLGLFIAREIIRRHGGEITASSARGATRVVVQLPRRAEQAGDAAANRSP